MGIYLQDSKNGCKIVRKDEICTPLLQVGDVIAAIDGNKVRSSRKLSQVIISSGPTVTLMINRYEILQPFLGTTL